MFISSSIRSNSCSKPKLPKPPPPNRLSLTILGGAQRWLSHYCQANWHPSWIAISKCSARTFYDVHIDIVECLTGGPGAHGCSINLSILLFNRIVIAALRLWSSKHTADGQQATQEEDSPEFHLAKIACNNKMRNATQRPSAWSHLFLTAYAEVVVISYSFKTVFIVWCKPVNYLQRISLALWYASAFYTQCQCGVQCETFVRVEHRTNDLAISFVVFVLRIAIAGKWTAGWSKSNYDLVFCLCCY